MEIQYNHPATKLVNQLNINIITGGYAAADHSWIGRSVCSPYSRLYYIDEGSGFLRYHGTEISLSPGHVYLIPAGLLFHYGCEKRVCQLYFHINIFTPNGFDLLRIPSHSVRKNPENQSIFCRLRAFRRADAKTRDLPFCGPANPEAGAGKAWGF